MFLKNVAIVTTLFNVAHKSKILRSSYISEFVRGTFRLQVPSQITFVNFDQVMFSNFCLFSVSLIAPISFQRVAGFPERLKPRNFGSAEDSWDGKS